MTATYREKRIRLILFIVAGILHGALLVFVVFPEVSGMKTQEEPKAVIISLVDVDEEPPPPPPVYERPPEIASNTVEAVAENIIETEDEIPDEVVVSQVLPAPAVSVQETEPEYMSMGRVSVLPQLPEDEIRRAMVYPRIARSSGIEGIVYLELFVDPQGNIRSISILRETPENRGFGEAAVNALRGIRAVPGEANGQRVGVRFRYPIRFTLR